MKYTKELSFFNLFLQKDDNVTLTWDFPDGFDDITIAKAAVSKLIQDTDWFVYIKHHNQIYAVAANMLEQTIVISEHFIWYRDMHSNRIVRALRDVTTKLPYIIHSCQAVEYYKNTLCQDVFSFDPEVKITCGKKVKELGNAYKDFCIATLGAVMITTMIPVYQLGCMDIYFKNPAPLLELWQQGFKSYNPFTKHYKTAPYTLQSYLIEREKTSEEVTHLTSIRDYFLNHGAMTNKNTNETIEVPIYMVKELLVLLNGALSDMGEEKSFLIRNMELQKKLKNEVKTSEDTKETTDGYHICRVCHLTLPASYPDSICPMCQENELFMAVKDFVREFDVNENDVAEHFNISIGKVRGWIKEGRISYKDVKGIRTTSDGKEARICRECGMLLPSSLKENICRNCANLAEASRQHAKAKFSVMGNLDLTQQDNSMHYGRKKH